jgi:hypothetical protein
MVLAGRRTLNVTVAAAGGRGAVSVNLPITVLGGAPEPTVPPQRVLTMLVKLKGVDAIPSAAAVKDLSFKLKFINRETQAVTIPATGQWGVAAQSPEYWLVSAWGDGVPQAGSYDIYIKGPKHLQKKFAGQPLAGKIQQLDLRSLGDLPPGDLPASPSQGGQDGIVNALDAVVLTGCFATPQEADCLRRADLDLDGTITARDMELMNSTINAQKWEDE